MTTGISNFFDFSLDKAAGSRPVLRLLNASCEWLEEVTGRTTFLFRNYVIDTGALSTTVLKPLDEAIYVISGLKGVQMLLQKPPPVFSKAINGKWEDSVKGVKDVFKTIKEASAGLRCLARIGFVVLLPCTTTLGIFKNSFGIASSFLDIGLRVHNLWKLSYEENQKIKDPEKLSAQKWREMIMISVSVLSIFLGTFGMLDTIYGEYMDPADRMPKAVLRFWGTLASLGALTDTAIDHFITNPPGENKGD